MYVRNEILAFGPGRRKEALERLNWIHSLMVPHAGFIQALVGKYLGDVSRHTIMRFWETEEAYDAFRATPDGSYGASRPEGIYTGEPVPTPLMSFGEAAGKATGNFLVKVQREVPAGAWDAFLKQQRSMMELAANLPGLVWARQLMTKDQDKALVVARFRNREEFEQLVDSSQYLEALSLIPQEVKHIRTECFEVVSDVGPKLR
jgi:heme-degrading monooxygenase HmoA